MGQSTDAYLFYGISADDEEDIDDIIKTLGFEPGECNDSFEALNQFLPDGLEQENHCSCDCPIPIAQFLQFASQAQRSGHGAVTPHDSMSFLR
jgi:hypothetical protein